MRSCVVCAMLALILPNLLVAQEPSQAQIDICNSKRTAIAAAFCPILANEFVLKRFSGGTYPPSGPLQYPWQQPVAFTHALFNRAYLKILEGIANKDATALANNAVNTAANSAAQALSVKAAVSQPGAGASATGSTSLVAKPTTTDLISTAAESGAFTDTVNGTTLTAKANINGLRRYIENENFSSLNPSAVDVLQHITVAATFNVVQSGSATASSSGAATSTTPTNILSILVPSNNLSFTSVGANWAIYRPYTPTSKSFGTAWQKAMTDYLTKNPNAFLPLDSDLLKTIPPTAFFNADPGIIAAQAKWIGDAAKFENSGDFGSFVSSFVTYMEAVATSMEAHDSSFDQNIVTLASDIGTYEGFRNTVLDSARGSLATLTYTYSTPPGKPATHDATAVFAYVWAQEDSGAQLTANFGGSWFASVPSGATYGRLKDFQISGEFDQPLPPQKGPTTATTPPSKATFSLAGYGQYQYAANILNVIASNFAPGTNISVPANSQIFTSTAGWLGVAQAKLTFNIGKGASIPIAVKWSNKTDLLDTGDWKGQFGFSYDLSALSSILAAK